MQSTDKTKSPDKTISYKFPGWQYEIIKDLSVKEKRSMRNMLFFIVEDYIKRNKLKQW